MKPTVTGRTATLADMSFFLLPGNNGAIVGAVDLVEVDDANVTSLERLENAAHALLAHHPLLRTHFVHKLEYNYELVDANLEAADYVERREVVSDEARAMARDEARIEMLRRRPSDIPFHMLLIVCPSTSSASLLIFIHHSIGDLQSMATILTDALAELDDPGSTKAPVLEGTANDDAAATIDLPPSIIKAVPQRYVSWWSVIKSIPSMYTLSSLPKLAAKEDLQFRTAVSPAPGNVEDAVPCRVEHKMPVDALLAAARAHKTTVQGALQAALCYAIVAMRIQQGRMPNPKSRLSMASTGTVDLRRHLAEPLDPRTVSNYSSGATILATVNATELSADSPFPPKESFWALSTVLSRDLRAAVADGAICSLIKLLDFMGAKRVKKAFAALTDGSGMASVANVGRIGLRAPLKHMRLSAGLTIEHAMMAIRDGLALHCNSCEGVLTLVANFSLPSMDPNEMERLLELVVANLTRASVQ